MRLCAFPGPEVLHAKCQAVTWLYARGEWLIYLLFMSLGIRSSLSIKKINSITNSFNFIIHSWEHCCLGFWLERHTVIRVNGLPLVEPCFTVMNGERFTAEVADGSKQDPGRWASCQSWTQWIFRFVWANSIQISKMPVDNGCIAQMVKCVRHMNGAVSVIM